jgi:(1->4)-alpha-D-glucan 1-alpha-D-glucosylmutase
MRSGDLERFRLRFVERFQQLSGPATAKGIEDTAFYAYAPLLSRNEVGGGLDAPLERAPAEFHAANLERAERWPGGMLTVSTHDTKRSADVRARLDVLSEIPAEWAQRLRHWRRLNVPYKTTIAGRRVPEPGTVHHLLQAMVGIWPLEPLAVGDLELLRERLAGYMEKAVREAKLRTSWTDPDEEYESALRADIAALLDPVRSPRFLDELERFVRRLARPGFWNALARTVLHLASPGVPDLYQGDELWNLTLVDPDNRRPVDFGRRAWLLDDVERGTGGDQAAREQYLRALVADPDDGRLKLHVIRSALAARRKHAAAFRSRRYLPLEASGRAGFRVVGFGRGEADERLIAVVPRRLGRHEGSPTEPSLWEDTLLPLPADWPRRWSCGLSGRSLAARPDGLPVAELFAVLPVALLLSEPSS